MPWNINFDGYGVEQRREDRTKRAMVMSGMVEWTTAVAIVIRGGCSIRCADDPSARNGLLRRRRAGGLDLRGNQRRERKKIGERNHRDRAQKAPFFVPFKFH